MTEFREWDWPPYPERAGRRTRPSVVPTRIESPSIVPTPAPSIRERFLAVIARGMVATTRFTIGFAVGVAIVVAILLIVTVAMVVR
jgi:hypothetical protein